MRYPKGHKDQTRRRIVDAAARSMRAEGVAAVSIAGLMGELGLTHGGFYAHFASKEALVAEACRAGLLASSDALFAPPPAASPGAALHAVIDGYLSARHRDNPAEGCVLPALAGEIAREPAAVRRTFTESFQVYLDHLASLVPGDDPAAGDRALVLAAGMAGSILLARAVDDPVLSDRILAAGRAFYSATFATSTGDPVATPPTSEDGQREDQ